MPNAELRGGRVDSDIPSNSRWTRGNVPIHEGAASVKAARNTVWVLTIWLHGIEAAGLFRLNPSFCRPRRQGTESFCTALNLKDSFSRQMSQTAVYATAGAMKPVGVRGWRVENVGSKKQLAEV